MPYTELFGCEPASMAGIKTLKLATMDINNNPLDFPLDIQLKLNDEAIIVLSDDQPNRIITIGGVQIQYRIVYPINSSFNEEEISDRQGRFYRKTLNFEMPQLSLTTINQLKNFLFTTSGDFAISNAVAFITDLNNNKWIVGYDIPLILQTLDLQTDVDAGDNKFTLSYVSNGYQRTRAYEVI